MGLFGGKKTYVSSTLYNMAGDIEERPEFLKNLIAGNIITDSNASISETLMTGYIRGPGIRMRSFFRWAENNYGDIGVPTGSLGGSAEIDLSIVQGEIPPIPGKSVRVQAGFIGPAEYSYWAERWMFENEPDLLNTDWFSDINETTGDIQIDFADLTSVTFTPTGFNRTGQYIYAYYSLVQAAYEDSIDVGDDVPMLVTDAFPSMAGWNSVSDTTTPSGLNSVREWVYTQVVYDGLDPETNETVSTKSTSHHFETRDPVNIVIERKYRVDTQRLVSAGYGDANVFIYEVGSGNNVLDALVEAETTDGEYVPYIPIRLDNKFLSPTYKPEAYALAKRAYKKATGGGKLDDLIDRIADNESLGDIDYAYIMYGVPLNTKEMAAKEYLYRFFDKLRLANTPSNSEFAAWQATQGNFEAGVDDWARWKESQISGEGDAELYGDPDPGMAGSPGLFGSVPPKADVHVKSNGLYNTNLDMKIEYNRIGKETVAGLYKPDALKGQIWIDKAPDVSDFSTVVFSGLFEIVNKKLENQAFTITWQNETESYDQLTIVGAEHINLIYNNKSVDISSHDALEDTDESGFLVPLHYATVREMSLVKSTQMMTSATYVVFNSYKVVKQKWYQTGIFKIFIFVLIIALTIIFPPAGGVAAGILGSAAAVGLAVGLTGLVGLIVGAVINALVAMIIMKIIMIGSVEIFGEKWGQIIGAVLSLISLQVGTALSSGASMATAFNNMMSASNIINMTSAVGNGIAGYVQASTQGIANQTSELMKDYKNKSTEISELFAQNLGYDTSAFDPMRLTDNSVGNFMETEQVFLSRTLMTGTDIAEMTNNMLTNFSELTLSTKLPLSG